MKKFVIEVVSNYSSDDLLAVVVHETILVIVSMLYFCLISSQFGL